MTEAIPIHAIPASAGDSALGLVIRLGGRKSRLGLAFAPRQRSGLTIAAPTALPEAAPEMPRRTDI